MFFEHTYTHSYIRYILDTSSLANANTKTVLYNDDL